VLKLGLDLLEDHLDGVGEHVDLVAARERVVELFEHVEVVFLVGEFFDHLGEALASGVAHTDGA